MVRFIFYIEYFSLFVFGGILNFSGLVHFRMAYMVFLPLLILPFYFPKFNGVVFNFLLFAIVIIISGFINNMGLEKTLIFFRFIIIPFSMYFLSEQHITSKNIYRIMKISIILGVIQLPIVIFQKIFGAFLLNFSAVDINPIDFDFGTFYTADDPAMCFFLLGLIISLLYDNRNDSLFRSKKIFLIVWFSVTILITNSRLSQLILISILLIFFLRKVNYRKILTGLSISVIILIIIFSLGFWDNMNSNIESTAEQFSFNIDYKEETNFLNGGYSRQAAILFYLSEPIKIFGDGPSKYFDPITKDIILGNRGQIFTVYSEVGLLGILLSYMILFQIAKKYNKTSPIAIPYFIIVSLLTLTTSVMTDASIMFAYNIFLRIGFLSRIKQINT